MENKLKYSFDDEVVSKFCYDIDNKKIEVYFTGYTEEERFLDRACVFTIENWKEAKSRIGDEKRLYSLDHHMGIFSMILYMKYNDDGKLEILVNTLDNRYVTFLFEEPQLRLL